MSAFSTCATISFLILFAREDTQRDLSQQNTRNQRPHSHPDVVPPRCTCECQATLHLEQSGSSMTGHRFQKLSNPLLTPDLIVEQFSSTLRARWQSCCNFVRLSVCPVRDHGRRTLSGVLHLINFGCVPSVRTVYVGHAERACLSPLRVAWAS